MFPWLSVIVLLPLVASVVIPFLSEKDGGKQIKWFTLVVSLVDFLLMVAAFYLYYDPTNPGMQLVERYVWIPQIGLEWSVGVDGLAMPLLLLTGFITTLAVLASWPVTLRPKFFFFLMLAMLTGMAGVFLVQDMILFFLFWELELIPVYLLLAIWGGYGRLYAATKFILYTALSSLFILAVALALYFQAGTFNMVELSNQVYPFELQILCFIGLFIAYAVKLPVFPFHTWLPDAHGEATAPVHMLLAGILLKMGGYALIRMNVGFFPDATQYFAPVLIGLGIINIIYAALTSFAQGNLKRKIAYSSISHMGFVLIGIGSLTEIGMSGAMLQMVSHGLIGASLFFLVGATYDRTHTLILKRMGGIAQKMPRIFAMFTACSFASLALPGMSGFVAELMIFVGMATSDAYSTEFKTVVVLLAAIGVILTPIYLLSMLREIFYTKINHEFIHEEDLIDAEPREVFVIAALLVPIFGIGLYPKLTTDLYDATTTALVQTNRARLEPNAQQTTPWRLVYSPNYPNKPEQVSQKP
ncbi:NAD(P)H-quinone oxidoreductase subunit 4 [Candidatus Cyanaurora vandensis]|uniref:NAD(P)H-quinone oxidoreductase subunit 4 n=1 Tax=Candidatus Cyanaurora vandensis TaxID=2714958 RepID=UPI00257E42ED|nr:NAD(P)H-quinone oxidoreductase subunit 4 [Candidatus Cyanaurora vandensis]